LGVFFTRHNSIGGLWLSRHKHRHGTSGGHQFKSGYLRSRKIKINAGYAEMPLCSLQLQTKHPLGVFLFD